MKTLLSYDYGPNVLHPSDFVSSCNELAIVRSLEGTFSLTKRVKL